MVNEKLKDAKKQRGMALTLVLVSLAFGSLLIVPTLRYVQTGLFQTSISSEMLADQYAADAAVEYNLWQLNYNVDNITDELNPENPSIDTSITVKGIEVPITTEITQSPLGDTWPFPVPLSQQGISLTTALVIESPYFSEDGQTAYFPHVVYMFNSGTSTLHMKAALQELDPRLTYLPGSYDGPDASLTETYVNNHWKLHIDFATPLPKLDAQDATFISFVASTSEEVEDNTYTGSGWVSYAAFGSEEEEYFEGEYGPGTIGYYYDITATAGSVTIRVNVGITEEGKIVILSYQIQ